MRSDTELGPARPSVGVVLLRLDNGIAVLIRPIAPEDKALLATASSSCRPQSAYQRFLAPKAALSADELRYLTEVDFRRPRRVVAVRPEAPDVVGVGRWIRSRDDPEVAEIAFVVSDALQRQGLGTLLAGRWPTPPASAGCAASSRRCCRTTSPRIALFARVAQERETAVDGPLHELRGAIRPAA